MREEELIHIIDKFYLQITSLQNVTLYQKSVVPKNNRTTGKTNKNAGQVSYTFYGHYTRLWHPLEALIHERLVKKQSSIKTATELLKEFKEENQGFIERIKETSGRVKA